MANRKTKSVPGIRQLVGGSGERAAARFLRRQGYSIIARNYRCPAGEIDLVALDNGTVVFIEVKTRRGPAYGDPLEAVDSRKQRQIARVAMQFVSAHRLHDRAVRF